MHSPASEKKGVFCHNRRQKAGSKKAEGRRQKAEGRMQNRSRRVQGRKVEI